MVQLGAMSVGNVCRAWRSARMSTACRAPAGRVASSFGFLSSVSPRATRIPRSALKPAPFVSSTRLVVNSADRRSSTDVSASSSASDVASVSAGVSAQQGVSIHPTSVVHPDAVIHPGVEIGPFCHVGPEVTIGEGCRLMGHNTLVGSVVLGANNKLVQGAIIGSEEPGEVIVGEGNTFGHYACIGVRCQDLKYVEGAACYCTIGDRNDIREHVSIHRSSFPDDLTSLGSDNLIMGGVHIAHDVRIGSNNVIANGTLFAGHVIVRDRVVIGGGVAIQQRCVIGGFSFLAGGAMVERDVPPFLRVQGDRARARGVNDVLLERCGFPEEEKKAIKEVFKALYFSEAGRKMGRLEQAQALLEEGKYSRTPHALSLVEFVVESETSGRESTPPRVGSVVPN